MGVVKLIERPLRVNPGGVDKHVKLPDAGAGSGNGGRVAQVNLERFGAGQRLDDRRSIAGSPDVDVVVGGELLGNRAADAAGRPCDKCLLHALIPLNFLPRSRAISRSSVRFLIAWRLS